MSEGSITRTGSESRAQSGAIGHRPAAAIGADAPGGAASDLQAFFVGLLQQQCTLTGGVAGLVYLAASAARNAGVAATFAPGPAALPATNGAKPASPAGAPASVALDRALVARMERVGIATVNEGRAVVEAVSLGADTGLYHAEATHRLVGCPLTAADQVHGATVIVIPVSVRAPANEALEKLRLTSARFETYLWQQQALGEAHAKARLRETLELLDAAQQGGDAEAMGSLFCHELARRFGCTRVSIGLVRAGGRLRLAAVSGADDLDRRGAAAEAIEAAMEECADQDIEIIYPAPAETEADPSQRRVVRAHADLSARFGPAAILSLPLRVEGDLVGVVVLEREASDPFPHGAVPLMRLIAEFIGPALWTRRMADRGVLAVVRDRSVELAGAAVGPRHTGLKALILLVALVIALAALVPIPGRVIADGETRAAISRMIPAPFEGYIKSIDIKLGDRVQAGQLLATLNDEELRLELAKAIAQREQSKTRQADARAKNIQSDVDGLDAAIRECQATIDLLTERIQRTRIVAPIAGSVSRGDLEPLLGARVDPTQPLFEIIDEGSLVALLDVSERDIGRVRPGQHGRLALAGRPEDKLPVTVKSVRPAAEPVQGKNVYKVEVEFDAPSPWVKAGMTGTARLATDRTTALSMVMRPLIEKVRLYLWW